MHLQPQTPEGQAFLADHLGEDAADPEHVAGFIHDECSACLICGELFTTDDDFDPDILSEDGERVCLECEAGGEYDPVDAQREWGTWG